MHKSLNLIIVAAVLSCICGCDHRVPTIVGNVDIYEGFPSEFVEARTIRVWSPDGYDSSIKYDVIYMHDGQNLFDSSTTWNH